MCLEAWVAADPSTIFVSLRLKTAAATVEPVEPVRRVQKEVTAPRQEKPKSPDLKVESLVKGLMAEITEDYSVEVRMDILVVAASKILCFVTGGLRFSFSWYLLRKCFFVRGGG